MCAVLSKRKMGCRQTFRESAKLICHIFKESPCHGSICEQRSEYAHRIHAKEPTSGHRIPARTELAKVGGKKKKSSATVQEAVVTLVSIGSSVTRDMSPARSRNAPMRFATRA
jgi:hypothetical protein